MPTGQREGLRRRFVLADALYLNAQSLITTFAREGIPGSHLHSTDSTFQCDSTRKRKSGTLSGRRLEGVIVVGIDRCDTRQVYPFSHHRLRTLHLQLCAFLHRIKTECAVTELDREERRQIYPSLRYSPFHSQTRLLHSNQRHSHRTAAKPIQTDLLIQTVVTALLSNTACLLNRNAPQPIRTLFRRGRSDYDSPTQRLLLSSKEASRKLSQPSSYFRFPISITSREGQFSIRHSV